MLLADAEWGWVGCTTDPGKRDFIYYTKYTYHQDLMLRNRNRLQSGFIGRAHRPPAAASPGSPLPSIDSLSPRLQADGLWGSANGSASTGRLSVVLSPACSQQRPSPDAHACAQSSSSTWSDTPCKAPCPKAASPKAVGRAGGAASEASALQRRYQGALGQAKAGTALAQGVQQLGASIMTKSPAALSSGHGRAARSAAVKREAGLDADGSAALAGGAANAPRHGRLTSKRCNKKKDAPVAAAARRDSMTRLASSGQDPPPSSPSSPPSSLAVSHSNTSAVFAAVLTRRYSASR